MEYAEHRKEESGSHDIARVSHVPEYARHCLIADQRSLEGPRALVVSDHVPHFGDLAVRAANVAGESD